MAHYNYAQQIPQTINQYISPEVRSHLSPEQANTPIGLTAVMHSHNTLPNMAQKYKQPIWQIPNLPNLEAADRPTIMGNRAVYEATKQRYVQFANSFLERINTLN